MTHSKTNPADELQRLAEQNKRLERRTQALERNRRELENRILQLRTLYEIGAETASMLAPAGILQVILSQLMRAFDAVTGLALTVSEADDGWLATFHLGFTPEEWEDIAADFAPHALEDIYYEWYAQRSPSASRWLVVAESEEAGLFVEWLRRLDIHVWLPFAVDHMLVGGLGLGPRMVGSDLTSGELDLLSGILENAVERIKSARLMDKLLREQQELYRTRGMFEQFMAPQVVDRLLDGRLKVTSEGYRQKVTILTADLRHSTEMVLRLDTEEMVRFLSDYFTETTDIVFSYEGMVDKFLGDGVMAVFGAPVAHGQGEMDDVTRAVRAALDMQAAFEKLLASWKARWGHTLDTGLGIGVCTGVAIAGNIGSGKRVDHTVIGPVVNLASRLSKIAAGGQTLIDEETFRTMSLTIPSQPLDPVTVKGFSEPVPVYRLT
jgi:class 3 adenylate cyclase